MKTTLTHLAVALAALSIHTGAWALDAAGTQQLQTIQQRWAQIQYDTPQERKVAEFEKLAAQAEAFTTAEPKAAEAWIWKGIVTSSWAGAQGGLGALGQGQAIAR